jgi:branched-chain amino acid transport system substrate-binding protein
MASTRFYVLACTLALSAALGAPPAAAQDILIGQVASQTSPVTAANAKALYAGINAYFEFVNGRGGVGGRNVKLVNKDDELKTDKMIALTHEFIADRNVLALAGYQNTGGITEVSKQDIPGKAGIAMIAPFQGDKSIVGAANFFPFRSRYPDEVTALIKEAKFTQKKNVVLVYQNVTYGPAMMKLAQEVSKQEGLNVVAWIQIDATQPDKLADIVRDVTAATVKEAPDGVIVLAGGKSCFELLKALKSSPAEYAQIYLMSIVPQAEVLKTIGDAKARGIVIAQAVPYPYSATLPLVGEYQRLMKQYAPSEPLSFSSLEGFVVAKITVEALKRASPHPTREKVLKALTNMGELNLGGVYVNYTPKERKGWGGVDLTVIGPNGKLLR